MARDPSTPPPNPSFRPHDSSPPTEALPDTQSSPVNENSPAARTTRPSPSQPTRPEQARSFLSIKHVGHLLTGVWAIVAATVTAANLPSVQSLEREAQSLLVRVRGTVAPPSEVIILAIDEESLLQLSNWPLRRAVYAQTIDKVMKAGAKAVGVDVIWDLPSSYGSTDQTQLGCVPGEQRDISEDDRQLQTVLKRYDGRISLAAKFNNENVRQGEQANVSLPYCPFRTERAAIGTTNFLVELNGRMHRLGNQFLATLPTEEAEIVRDAKLSSFADATLQAAKISYEPPQGENIFFYGGAKTFETISFWNVLSPENWESEYLKKGQIFKDKIVLIGPTTTQLNDIHNTPFSDMSGVEIHANAIATLLENRSIRQAFPDPVAAGGMVLVIVLGAAFVQTRTRHPIARLLAAGAIAFSWGSLSYVAFTNSLVILPTAIPMGAIVLVGMSYLGMGVATDRLNSQRTRQALMRRSRSPMIQEIIEEQDDLKDLLRERELEIANKTLKNRYKIDKVLASGGFGETYIAKDLQRPQDPECVVKHLHPVSNHPSHLRLASRMFAREAEILERLGKKHDQIPRLLAYFEEDQEFYLVQEFIAGSPLSEEFFLGRQLPEARVVHVLKEILQILHFVHEENVIHRDVKPSNIIKRSDGKLVLIDFGAVKDQYNKLASEETQTNLTVGIGTQGYMAPEQGAGKPQPNSDVYAVGMMGIQALTGLPPSQLKEDPDTKEITWQDKAQVSSGLANILSKMVRYDFRDRYQSALEAIQDLKKLSNASTFGGTIELPPSVTEDDVSTMTRPWPETFGSEELPRTEPPPKEE
ncbi:CHASE2 domain-containing protein [Phormidesmis sp. 146-12]